MSYESNSVEIASAVSSRYASKNLGRKQLKTKNHARVVFHPFAGANALNFGIRGDIADVITHAKFCDNRFRDFGVLIPPVLPFCIGIALQQCKHYRATL